MGSGNGDEGFYKNIGEHANDYVGFGNEVGELLLKDCCIVSVRAGDYAGTYIDFLAEVGTHMDCSSDLRTMSLS